MEWRSISPELAKQHPLYGVGGWLVFFIVYLGLLILISPIIQIAAKSAAGFSSPTFTPSAQWVMYFVVIWYIVKKRSEILNAYLIIFPGISILGTILLFSLQSELSAFLHFGPEDLILTVLIRDVPFVLYLFNSRRARVTFKHQVRADDPILDQSEEVSAVNGLTSETIEVPVSGKRASPVPPQGVVTASAPHHQTRPEPTKSTPKSDVNMKPEPAVPAPEPDKTNGETMDTEETEPENYLNASMVIKYDKTAAVQFKRLSDVPDEFSIQFLEALEADARCDTEALTNKLLEEHRKQIAPYEDEKLNVALAEMREISPEAEQEFKKAVDVIGEDRVDPEFVCQQIRENILPPKKVAFALRFGERTVEIADATELLEMLGYEVRRSGSGDYGFEYQILMGGKSLRTGLVAFNVVAFANEKLREIIEAD